MALSHLLQPKLNLPVCRLSLATARAGFFSLFSKGDNDNPPQTKKEAATEETGIMAAEQSEKESLGESSGYFSKETSAVDLMAGYDGSTDSKRLSDLFKEHKDDPIRTTVENEVINSEAALNNLLGFLDRASSVANKETSNLDDKCSEFKEIKECQKVPIQRQRQRTSFSRKGSLENRVLIRFLWSSVSENQLFECFKDCGQILKIEVPSAKGPLLKTAYIDFKTREGFEKALEKSGSLFMNGLVTVESANVLGKKTVKTPIPGLLGDPDIPPELVKNPTRTIKIENLTEKISSHHIEEALAFCKSNISGYSLGSSHTIAYVEFETEIGKERALAEWSINVLGRRLVMLRIDCPRTTVVRISNFDALNLKNVLSICESHGDIRAVSSRAIGVVDVYFKVSEWPNMTIILNRLNGCVIDGRRLQAEPAPVFPPDVLLALWHHPEERKRLQATSLMVLNKLSDNTVNMVELASLESEFIRM